MRDGEPQIYTSLATIRNGYLQGQWQRVQMFLVFNTVAVPLVLGSATSADIKFFIGLAGVLTHFTFCKPSLTILPSLDKKERHMPKWPDGLTKGSTLSEKIFTPFAYLGVIVVFAILFALTKLH